jgi:hypothetical protein
LFYAALHDAELDGYDACHFNCATEGYLNVVVFKKLANIQVIVDERDCFFFLPRHRLD